VGHAGTIGYDRLDTAEDFARLWSSYADLRLETNFLLLVMKFIKQESIKEKIHRTCDQAEKP
jgi:hypothetical protein